MATPRLFCVMEADSAVSGALAQLLQLKHDGAPPDWQSALAAGALRILDLKRAHRNLCDSTEALRDDTSLAKTLLDQSSLQLQNLLYEKQHYEKEISSCRAFKSAYSEQQVGGCLWRHAALWHSGWQGY